MAREFDKLVRDAIPDVIEANGEDPTIHVADGEEYSDRLVEKLDEEVQEYRDSRDVEELADVLEVVHTIRKDRGVSSDELAEIRARKAERRGRFEEGVVLERVEE
jgi:predicted house-cleaning noncanonical NTP pyrophosphatase (MazG superfamily)